MSGNGYIFSPKKLHTSYCGLPLSNYGLDYYGREAISVFIEYIKICEHGDQCVECCFTYSGPCSTNHVYTFQAPESNFKLPCSFVDIKKNGRKRLPILTYLFDAVLGPAHRINTQKFRTCKNPKCCNLHHVKFNVGLSTPYFILSKVHRCKHGNLCKECCWEWKDRHTYENKLGKKFILIRNVKENNIKTTKQLHRYLIDNILHINMNGKIIIRNCGNDLCGNWNHTVFKTKAQRMIDYMNNSPRYKKYREAINARRNKALNSQD